MEQPLKGKSILFATVPGDGHINPLTCLAKYLHGMGCDVGCYTSEVYADTMEYIEIPFYPFKLKNNFKLKSVNELSKKVSSVIITPTVLIIMTFSVFLQLKIKS